MRKLSLSEWAQLGDVIGMVAVVASLLVVVYSIDQNTQALQGANGNVIFERHAELDNHFISDPAMAAILLKKRRGEPPLSEIEAVRWDKYRLNLIDIWAMAHGRNAQGLMLEAEWVAWNGYFVTTFANGPERLGRAEWEAWTYAYGNDFWDFVGRELGHIP